MKKNLVTLVGEQPLPTLLSIRHLDTTEVLFVGTREWHATTQHLQALMGRERHIHIAEVRDPYDPPAIHAQVKKKLRKLGWSPETMHFDLSGGNKMMAFAAYQWAMEGRSELVKL
jgi:hypothetical protein